jgi:hypothetical protein
LVSRKAAAEAADADVVFLGGSVAQEAQPFPRVGECRAGLARIEVVAEPADSPEQIDFAICKRDCMFDHLGTTDRINEAKTKMEKLIGHFLYVLELHANNTFVVYSPTLSSQIPQSFAANAFNVFQRSMHQIEIVRLCALWDRPELVRENIPTVIELIDDTEVIKTLVDEVRTLWADRGGYVYDKAEDPNYFATSCAPRVLSLSSVSSMSSTANMTRR